MNEDLPSEFDLIVVGTGLTESIVAAAASRVGKTVLHLDPNDFYGGYWASFNLEAIQTLPGSSIESEELPENNAVVASDTIKLTDNLCRLQNIVQKWSQPSNDSTENVLKDKALKEFRKFNIDITPKLLFARGKLVELLISSNICRYAEFRAVDRVATLLDGELKAVPCSRSDVFTTKAVSVVEKRILMKVLSTCLNSDDSTCEAEFKDYQEKTFAAYLQDKRLTANLQHYVLYAICMGDEHTSCPDGVLATRRFLESLGRYGNTPFLFPMYGCGEIPQCFCRLCAVFGGVYCLKRNVSEVSFTAGMDGRRKFQAIQCGGQRITANNIVFGAGTMTGVNLIPEAARKTKDLKCGRLSRGIFLVDVPLGDAPMNSGGGGVVFTKIPAELAGQGGGAYVIQLSHYSGACPKEWYLVHVTCPSIDNAENDLKEYVDQLFKDYRWTSDEIPADVETEKARQIIWSMYFTIPTCEKCMAVDEIPFDGVFVACAPFFEVDYDRTIEQAQSIFREIYADEEFLPRAPDPEEIVIGGDEETETTANDLAALDIKDTTVETPSAPAEKADK